MPLYACEPGSPGPSYASTSVSRTATAPSAVSCRRTAPSRRGATSRTGPARDSDQPGTVVSHGGAELGELLGHPRRSGAAAGVAGGHGALDREHLAHRGGQVRVDL